MVCPDSRGGEQLLGYMNRGMFHKSKDKDCQPSTQYLSDRILRLHQVLAPSTANMGKQWGAQQRSPKVTKAGAFAPWGGTGGAGMG